jgi:solute carrier family 25 (mitochondrial phosphate transporter), member 3
LIDTNQFKTKTSLYTSVKMPLFPSASSLKATFDPNGVHAKANQYWINSSIEDKAASLSKEAEAELAKAGQAIKNQTKGIKLYSPEFYAACTVGGILGK